MTVFTPAELAYLRSQKLGRMATIGPHGAPQVRPVGFAVDAETGTIDIIGRDNPGTQKWRNVVRDGRVALVVDDLAPDRTWLWVRQMHRKPLSVHHPVAGGAAMPRASRRNSTWRRSRFSATTS